MTSKFNDQDVLKLLTDLKNTENTHPTDVLQSRRDTYIKQAAAMAVLAKAAQSGSGASPAGTNSPSNPLAKLTPHTGKILEIALISAIVLETVVVAYIYRDRIRDFFNDVIPPRVENVTNPTVDFVTPSSEATSVDNEAITDTPTPTITVTVTEEPTIIPIVPTSNNNSSDNKQINATPPPKENPGNHYGNTPKPDRDKNNNDQKDKSSPDKGNKK